MKARRERATNWREHILSEFTPEVAPLTLVADPDGLLLEETLLHGIRDNGFELIPFENPTEFRFAYESGFRSHWDQGEARDREVVLRLGARDFGELPYDLLKAGRRLTFNLGELFPCLSYPVVAALDQSDLDTLYKAQQDHQPQPSGEDATKDFVLLHVFDVRPDLVKSPTELLRVLLRRHYRRQRVPPLVDERLIRVLGQHGAFDGWPLETIIPSRGAFWEFLQQRWPQFLDRLAGSARSGLLDADASRDPAPEGPAELPFGDDDVRVYVDNLFLEGMLRPVRHLSGAALSKEWVRVGIRNDPIEDSLHRIEGLSERIERSIPSADARHTEWTDFAYRWAELNVVWSEAPSSARTNAGSRVGDLRARVDQGFRDWMEHRYAGLHNQPSNPPVMVHHLPRFLARQLAEGYAIKVALVVVDGLSIDQWIVLRTALRAQRPELRFREEAVFAWVPTTTSVSRQAIFAGQAPLFFPSSIGGTSKEQALWTRFWSDQGLSPQPAGYAKGLGDGPLDHARDLVSRPGTHAVGVVVDKIDKIMHGMQLGTAGMHNQVRQWAQDGFMASLFDLLLDSGFAVFLTSDHGNVEAKGCGRPREGALAEVRGERARVFSDATLRTRVKADFPDAVEWPAVGLPDDYLALLAPDRWAFVRDHERIVTHGGICLEEVVVPMIEIRRATR
ncbi:MAG: BREX-3 system phosphatase PglZ [Gammaproteobacteria bacterium]|nr:BREX-3 system phosphatase PglZ [Gammaproteobacteria bacterium]